MKSYVYYAAIPSEIGSDVLYPPERMVEIERCRSEKSRREKYYVWRLLEIALKDALSLDIANIKFTKKPNNKWVCDDCFFSLAHTEGLASVAVSTERIGVDAERVRALRGGIAEKILTEREMARLGGMTEREREDYLLERWCAKEAIFKAGDSDALLPKTIETAEHRVHTERVVLGGEDYVLTICTDGECEIKCIQL